MRFSSVIVCLFGLGVALAFQGCGRPLLFKTSSTGSAQYSPGNGSGEEGNVYAEKDAAQPCTQHDSQGNVLPNAEIIVYSTKALLTRLNCAFLNPPQSLNLADLQLNADSIGGIKYQNTLYDPVVSPTPTLDIELASTQSIPSNVAITRASPATYFDVTGKFVTAASNAPRFDYDPVSHTLNGLLVEGASTNLLTYSQNMNAASWSSGHLTVLTDGTLAPDSASQAYLLREDTTSGTNISHSIEQYYTFSPSTTYTFSAFAKTSGRALQISMMDLSGSYRVCENDLVNGVILDPKPGCSIQDVGNGWYRLSMTFNSGTGTNNSYVYMALDESDGATYYTGDGVSGAYVWGAQLEEASSVSSYIATTSIAVTRSADSVQLTDLNWYNSSAGTLYAEYVELPQSNGPAASIFGLYGSGSDSIALSATGTTGASSIIANSSSVFSPSSQLNAPGSANKIIMSYSINGYSYSANGGAPVSSSGSTLPTAASSAYIGSEPDGNIRTRYIRNIRYYTAPLPRNLLQQLSQ